MSFNQPSGYSPYTSTTEGLSDEGKRGSREGSVKREDEEALKEEINTSVKIEAGTPLILKSGPPPPLPLTPPTLLTDLFTFQDRRLSTAMSSMGDLDTSFFSQPNPDYTFQSLTPTLSDSTSTALPHGRDDDFPSIPRRRSYTKLLPLGPGHHADSEHDGAASFSPSSFPSSSPSLPLAPHESLYDREIDVKGEIVSVMDDAGAGWKRHTRVYGGGPCLCCRGKPDGQGGFYGVNVPMEHRR
ncbi:Transcription factor mbp1 (MBF subunit p120) [Hypoxylon texense]